MLTFEQIKNDPSIKTYISRADESLIALGYTEHSFPHVNRVASVAKYILETLGYFPSKIETKTWVSVFFSLGFVILYIIHTFPPRKFTLVNSIPVRKIYAIAFGLNSSGHLIV